MKYFITSDVHSFLTPMLESLKKVGYDKDNPEHCLVIDGDLFDRGSESVQILEFIKSIPSERRILIRGNHEYLLEELLRKKYPDNHDYSNGTVKTCFDLYTARHPKATKYKKLMMSLADDLYCGEILKDELFSDTWTFNQIAWNVFSTDGLWEPIAKDITDSGLINWINGDEWKDYLEIGNYIIVHSFIPMHYRISYGTFFDNEFRKLNPDWRTTSTKREWIDASWWCPYKLFDSGYFDDEMKNGKILVSGHWHCSDYYRNYDYPFYFLNKDNNAIINKMYVGENIIGLDACTVLSNFCNVLVLDEAGNRIE